jgi:hypothetical protein
MNKTTPILDFKLLPKIEVGRPWNSQGMCKETC